MPAPNNDVDAILFASAAVAGGRALLNIVRFCYVRGSDQIVTNRQAFPVSLSLTVWGTVFINRPPK